MSDQNSMSKFEKTYLFIFLVLSGAFQSSCQLEPIEESNDPEEVISSTDDSEEASMDRLDELDDEFGDDEGPVAQEGGEENLDDEFEELMAEDDLEEFKKEEDESLDELMALKEEEPKEEVEEGEPSLDDELDDLLDNEEPVVAQAAVMTTVPAKSTVTPLIVTNNALIKAAKIGTPETIRYLLKKGFDINYINELGETSLHAAAANKRWENVKALLRNGANKEITNSKGQTAEQIAGQIQHKLTINAFKSPTTRGLSSEK